MINISEYGLISIITDLIFVTSVFIGVKDIIQYIKNKKSIVSAVIFLSLSLIILTVGLLTDYMRFDSIGILISLIFLSTLFISIKLKKTVLFFWITVFILLISGFIGFISYTLRDYSNLLTLDVIRIKGKTIEGYISYNGIVKEFKTEGDMIGFESFQVVIKQYLRFIFGGKRFVVTAFFTESFSDDGTEGKTRYYPIGQTFINRRDLWNKLEAKKIILIGFEGVQRLNVSVYPKVGRYTLKFNEGLYLIKN